MPTMNFPSLPTSGNEYLFNNTTYVYDGTKWVAKQSNEQNINQMIESHKVGVAQHRIAGIQGLADELSKIGDAVLDVKWLTKRSPMRTGYTAGDGQTLSRALYPDAIAAIQSGLVPTCADAEWLADPAKRGCFTLGDGSTTFRVPDYNGKSEGSLGAAFLRGDGLNSAGTAGRIQPDAIRNIIGGSVTPVMTGNPSVDGEMGTGVLRLSPSGSNMSYQSGRTMGKTLTFDASRVVPTAADNHPVNATGCWSIKLFGAVQNAGSADAAALATAVAGLSASVTDLTARVSVLEQRKSTCLVNMTGTGATHETVVTQLPASIVKNSRYVLSNPFGAHTPVECWAEVFFNGVWSRTGFVSDDGTEASYVQGVGIVIQTGASSVVTHSWRAGGGHGANTFTENAPCRVFVRKLEA